MVLAMWFQPKKIQANQTTDRQTNKQIRKTRTKHTGKKNDNQKPYSFFLKKKLHWLIAIKVSENKRN